MSSIPAVPEAARAPGISAVALLPATSDHPTAPAVPWRQDARTAGLVGLGHGVSHFYQLAFAPLFPLWREEFGLNWTQLGLVMTLFYAVSCICQAGAGFVVDRHGPKRSLLAGFLLMPAGALIAAAAPGYATLLFAAVVIALGNSVFHPADFALLNHRVSERRIGHAFSAHGLSGTLGYASAPVLMAWMSGLFGWRSALVAAAGAPPCPTPTAS